MEKGNVVLKHSVRSWARLLVCRERARESRKYPVAKPL